MIRLVLCLLLGGLGSAAAAQTETIFGNPDSDLTQALRIQGSTDTDTMALLAQAFVARNPGLTVIYEELGTRELYELALRECLAGTSSADLLFSSAMDLQVALVNDHCSQPYHTPSLHSPPLPGNWRDEVFGMTRESAVLVYNTALLRPEEVPQTRYDLIDLLRGNGQRFSGRIATYDIRDSGVGYLFAFEDAKRATTYGRLIETFSRLQVELVCCAAPMIEGVAEGRLILAYNVLGSYAADRAEDDPRIGIVHFRDYSISISRAALIPRHARQPRMAGQFLEFIQSNAGQAALRDSHLLPGASPEDLAQESLIGLSPVLLLGLDTLKRQSFLDQFFRSMQNAPAEERR